MSCSDLSPSLRQLLPPLLVATIGGGLVGALVLRELLRRRPAVAGPILAGQPGLGAPGLAKAEERIRERGALRGFVQIAAGLPLKAYL